MQPLEFSLLGYPAINYLGQPLEFPVRKALALLGYLAVEKTPKNREALANLFWPDADFESARVALRKTLMRLRQALPAGGEGILQTTRENIALQPHAYRLDFILLAQTASELKRHSLTDLQKIADSYQGSLMQGFVLPDAPEFEAWLDQRRREADGHMERLLEHLAQRYDQGNQSALALKAARQRLSLDNLNEAAYHQLIELYLKADRRGEAVETYWVYRQVLADELGLAPNPEVAVLVEQVQVKQAVPSVLALPVASPKASGRYTTKLVGRSQEWDQLEAAYAKGLFIYIAGPAGIGKTRLMQEFAHSKGGYWGQFNAHSGDLGVPYASYARSIRSSLQQFPGLDLKPWVWAELSRIIPELSAGPANPLPTKEAKLRLFHAIAEFHIAIAPHMTGMLLDDIQFYDQASAEAALYHVSTWQRFGGESTNTQHFIATFRTGEMPPGVEEGIRKQAAAGVAALIELGPLGQEALNEMLSPLFDRPNPELIGRIHRFTGGNPLFALETFNSLDPAQPGQPLPLAPSVQRLIVARLESLSKPARNLARLAAVAGAGFSLDLAHRVFAGSKLIEAVEELEARQFFSGLGFAHDLLYEATLRSVLPSTRSLLHASILRAFQERPAHPVMMLRHALGAKNLEAVVEYSRVVSQEAQELQVQDEVQGLLREVERFLEKRGIQTDHQLPK